MAAPGKLIYYAHIRDVHQASRWPSPMRAVDARYQRQPGPYDPVALTAQYNPRYLHIPALGSQGCRNGEGGGTHNAVDWVKGLAILEGVYGAGLDLVVFCDCLEAANRAHRIGLAIRIAQATGRTFGGPLP